MEHLCEYTYCTNLTRKKRFCSPTCASKMQSLSRAIPFDFCLTCGSASIFCEKSCVTTHSKKLYPKRGAGTKKYCKACNTVPLNKNATTFCSNECFQRDRQAARVASWQDPNDPEVGLDANGTVKDFVKRWLIETQGECCSLCGWAKLNPYTNKIPLTADHIDGNWRNNSPSNLRLLCGSCDSLQATYKGANVGMGRPNRMVRYHQSQITYEEATTNGGS